MNAKRIVSTLCGIAAFAGVVALPGQASAGPIVNGPIAYSDNCEIWRMNPGGGGRKQLTHFVEEDTPDDGPGVYCGWFPAWSPDGKKIAFERGFEIWVMNADGTGKKNLHLSGTLPAWSPDGTRIAVSSQEASSPDIVVADADGTNPVYLTKDLAHDWSPTWSPDGKKIAFSSNRDDKDYDELYLIDANGGTPVRLTYAEGDDLMPDWSPDGKKIAYFNMEDNGYNAEIYVINADGTDPVRLTSAPHSAGQPTWSPDGKKIAYTSDFDALGQFDIYVMNADGTDPVALPSPPYSNEVSPDWAGGSLLTDLPLSTPTR